MNIQHLEHLPDEMRTKVKGILDELSTIQAALKVTQQRNRALRDDLAETLTVIGIGPGDTMDASDMGLRIRMVQSTSQTLDRAALERLGVSPRVLEQATVEKQGRLHLR